MQAMILAAGLGTRQLPLTLHLPKPLFPVLNRPLLHRTLGQLEAAGFSKIVINSFHLSHLLLEEVKSYGAKTDIVTLEEPSLLGTGGALRNALPFISLDRPLLVINGDVVTDLNPARILNLHAGHKAAATLVVHRRKPWNNVAVRHAKVSGFNYTGPDAMAFTGISVLEPQLIEAIPENRSSSLVEAFQIVLDQGGHVQALMAGRIADPYIWEDIGTPTGYLSAHKALLCLTNNRCLVGHGTELPGDLAWEDWVSIGQEVSLGSNVTLRRSVIWAKSRVPSGAVLEDCILTPVCKVEG